MSPIFLVFGLLFFVSFGVSSAFGSVDTVETDKSVYYDGDTMILSGYVSSELSSVDVSIVIFDPARSTFVMLGATTANSNGYFSTLLTVGGPTWTSYGIYPIKITSENHSIETSIEYRELPEPSDPSDPEPSAPEPSDPEPSDPEPSDPSDPSDPEPSDPEPSDPEPSDPSDPEPSNQFL